MIQIRLLRDMVHLRQLPKKTHSDYGIALAKAYQGDRMQYLVIGVGPKVPAEITPGCYVFIPMMQDSVTLDDGTLVAKASLCHAMWEKAHWSD